jgi:hypothetical protein
MRRSISTCLFLIYACFLTSCIVGGTHGSIREYCYSVRHSDLRYAVEKVLDSNGAVLQREDTSKSVLIHLHDGQSDTVVSNHPNSRAYTDFKIIHETEAYEYRIQYIGSETTWDTSQTACLSVAYAFDDEAHGGSTGNGGVDWSTPLLKQRLLAVFESEFIQRVDSALGVPAQTRK